MCARERERGEREKERRRESVCERERERECKREIVTARKREREVRESNNIHFFCIFLIRLISEERERGEEERMCL